MTKLRKFRTLEDKINLGLKIFCCLLILTIIVMGKSLAEYKQEAEVTFIRARVGKFKTNDIQLAMLLDGEEVETPPSKDNYTVDISCDNADGSWDSDRWAAVVGNITAGKVKCEVNFTTPAPTISEVTATANKTDIALAYSVTGVGELEKTCKYGTKENELTKDGTITSTGCTLNNLDRGVTYYYEVCVNSGNSTSVCKNGNSTTIAIEKPIVSTISASATENSITLSYSITGENITGYTCKYGTSTSYGSTATASSTKCIITGLKSSTTYYYQICGSNVSGQTCITGSSETSKGYNCRLPLSMNNRPECEKSCDYCEEYSPEIYVCYMKYSNPAHCSQMNGTWVGD